ncbi:hypothetical protein DFH28DRAFT_957793 [Melampsora americana]|nr:hypothetical protein DFH28DRAFT_957793 [Melampsora americana]
MGSLHTTQFRTGFFFTLIFYIPISYSSHRLLVFNSPPTHFFPLFIFFFVSNFSLCLASYCSTFF